MHQASLSAHVFEDGCRVCFFQKGGLVQPGELSNGVHGIVVGKGIKLSRALKVSDLEMRVIFRVDVPHGIIKTDHVSCCETDDGSKRSPKNDHSQRHCSSTRGKNVSP